MITANQAKQISALPHYVRSIDLWILTSARNGTNSLSVRIKDRDVDAICTFLETHGYQTSLTPSNSKGVYYVEVSW